MALILLLVIVVVGFLLLKAVLFKNVRPAQGQTDGTMTVDFAYQILGLPPSADPKKVKQVYRDLASAWHVDTSGITDDERMKELNAAYACLKQAGRAAR